MNFKKSFSAIILSVSMFTMSGCSLFDMEDENKVQDPELKLVLNGGTLETEVNSYKEGEKFTLPVPTFENYDFCGWYLNAEVSGNAVTEISATDKGDKTFYAKWSPKSYAVTLNANGGTLVSELSSYTYGSGATLPDVQKTGHTFKGWYDNENLTGDSVVKITSKDSGVKTYWASFTANKYSVTLNTNGGTLNSNITEYTYGTTVNLPEPKYGTRPFEGWFDNANFNDTAVTQIKPTDTGNKTFWAKWGQVINPTKSQVTLHLNGGTNNDGALTEYTEGVSVNLPADVTKTNYEFAGWFANSNLTGTAITKIPETQKGAVEYWAKWTPKSFTVTLNARGGSVNKGNITSYKYGTSVTLPTDVTRSGYTFEGWYDNMYCTGSKVTSISSTASGDKTFWAKWSGQTTSEIQISSCSGYDEGIYVEFPKVTGVSTYEIYYKNVDESTSFTKIDSQLIRETEDGIRADVVGIKAGMYELKIVAGSKTQIKDNITVTATDRSGYAHFGAAKSNDFKDGVGGYKNDGTPKKDAIIIYVNESNKNTVTAKIGSKTYTGLVSILQNAKSAPVIVRILGRISAPTWLPADNGGIEYTKGSSKLTPQNIIDQTYAKTQKTLQKKEYTQKELSDGGFNKLQTDIEELKGLSSKMLYSSKEFDSCWNDCSISSVKNVTIEGIGTDAEIFQWGMTWSNSNSIEIKNLTFTHYTEDACSFQGNTKLSDAFTSQYIWMHNNTFNEGMNYWDVCGEQDKHDGDGSTDLKGVSYVSLSYNHYINTHKTGLVGGDNSHKSANITFHHNYYEGCKSRLPLARQANMHMYNNYYYGKYNGEKKSDTCISIRANAYAFVENNYFEESGVPINIQGNDSEKGTYAVAKLFGNEIVNCKNNSYTESTLHADDLANNKSQMIVEATTRGQQVASNNTFAPNFDTDSELFYYKNNKTDVSNLTTADQAKTDCINYSGVLKKPTNG